MLKTGLKTHDPEGPLDLENDEIVVDRTSEAIPLIGQDEDEVGGEEEVVNLISDSDREDNNNEKTSNVVE